MIWHLLVTVIPVVMLLKSCSTYLNFLATVSSDCNFDISFFHEVHSISWISLLYDHLIISILTWNQSIGEVHPLICLDDYTKLHYHSLAKYKVSLWNFWNHIPCAHTALCEDCPCDGRHILTWRQTLLVLSMELNWEEKRLYLTVNSLLRSGVGISTSRLECSSYAQYIMLQSMA